MTCANGSLGMKYEHEMAAKTKALNPPQTYVPWVTLNGMHTKDIEIKAEKDLVGLICETYQVWIIFLFFYFFKVYLSNIHIFC